MDDNEIFLVASQVNDLKTLRKHIDNVDNGTIKKAFRNSCFHGFLEQAKWLNSSQIYITDPISIFDDCVSNNQQETAYWILSTFSDKIDLEEAFISVCELKKLKLVRKIVKENPDINFYVPYMTAYVNEDCELNLGIPEFEHFQYELDKAKANFEATIVYPNFSSFLEEVHEFICEYGNNNFQIILDYLSANLITLNNVLKDHDDGFDHQPSDYVHDSHFDEHNCSSPYSDDTFFDEMVHPQRDIIKNFTLDKLLRKE